MSQPEEEAVVVQGVASARGTGNVQEQIQELSRQHAEAMAAIANLSREPTRSYFYVPGERHIQPFSGDLGKDNRNVVRMTVTFLSTGRGPSSGALRVPIDQRKRRACLAPRGARLQRPGGEKRHRLSALEVCL